MIGIIGVVLGIAGIVMPYFAAVFLVPGAFVCGVIAIKRGQRAAGAVSVILAVLGVLWIAHVSQQLTNIAKDPFAPNDLLGSEGLPIVSLAEYDQVREGMTYYEVTAVIGAQGEELSRSYMAGYSTVMYSWSNASGSNMNAVFQNGRLESKAQCGLR